MGHFWPYSAWEACVNGVLASKLDVHINIGVIIVNIYILGYTGVNGLVSGVAQQVVNYCMQCTYLEELVLESLCVLAKLAHCL